MTQRRRFLAPEVIQASAMDCGPAALKCLLEGFGTPVSYGRLREACQTDIDGTSIDTLEEIATRLGLEAEQIMVPVDHLLLPEGRTLPALLVVRLPDGLTHFVVVWRRHGPLVQLMDPSVGRRWQTVQRLLEQTYVHTTAVPASGWRAWAGTAAFLDPLARRLKDLGVPPDARDRLVQVALGDSGWRSLAALDAAARMSASLKASGGLSRGREASRVLEHFFEEARQHTGEDHIIPSEYWSVRPAPKAAGQETLLLKGAVLVAVRGRSIDAARPALSPELEAALQEPPSRPGRELLRLLRADGVLSPMALLTALLLAAGGVLLQALLFRGIFDLGRELPLSGQRLAALGAVLGLTLALLLLDLPIASGLRQVGRRLEERLRMAFLEKLPKLGDRYFQSRLKSDMAERSHTIHQIRHLPELGGQMLRLAFELLLTAAGIAWLDPREAPIAIVSALAALALPLAVQPVLTERDLRVRSHTGALSRFYLDSLLGLVAIRAHGSERTLRREHEGLVVEWARSAFGLQRVAVTIEAVQLFVGLALAAWLLVGHLARQGEGGAALLLVYWALNLPAVGQEVAQIAWQYPGFRNTTLRLLEPLGALEENLKVEENEEPEENQALDKSQGNDSDEVTTPGSPAPKSRGVAIAFSRVGVRAAGHDILQDIDVEIAAGEHIAIVGPSGAGKSSLVGLLLGWHRESGGQVRVDGAALAGARREALRAAIAWVDPLVHLWNQSVLDNLTYGSTAHTDQSIAHVVRAADLIDVLKKLPGGLQTPLGEGGALLSGGEGQRVRLARALLRSPVRLAILDEPFRGLGREDRRMLLGRVRELWKDATLLCITHDVSETKAFDRVLVLDGGRVVEDAAPLDLEARAGSRYRALLEAEESVLEGLWSGGEWRRLRLDDGVLVEAHTENPLS